MEPQGDHLGNEKQWFLLDSTSIAHERDLYHKQLRLDTLEDATRGNAMAQVVHGHFWLFPNLPLEYIHPSGTNSG